MASTRVDPSCGSGDRSDGGAGRFGAADRADGAVPLVRPSLRLPGRAAVAHRRSTVVDQLLPPRRRRTALSRHRAVPALERDPARQPSRASRRGPTACRGCARLRRPDRPLPRAVREGRQRRAARVPAARGLVRGDERARHRRDPARRRAHPCHLDGPLLRAAALRRDVPRRPSHLARVRSRRRHQLHRRDLDQSRHRRARRRTGGTAPRREPQDPAGLQVAIP